MEVKVEKRKLKLALKTVAIAAAKKSPNPSMEGILWYVKDSRIVVAACNGSIQMNAVAECTISPGGETTATFVTKKLVIDMIDKMSDNEVVIDIKDEKKIKLKSGRSVYEVPVLGKDDFLHLSNVNNDTKTRVVVNQKDFQNAIQKIAFALAKNENVPILTGMKCEIDGNFINLVAMDGIRLGQTKLAMKDSQIGETKTIVIPGETARILLAQKALSQNSEHNIVLEFDNKTLKIKTNYFVLKTKLLSGTFLNVNNVLESLKEPQCSINLNNDEILQMITALDGLTVISKLEKSHLGIMSFDPEKSCIHIKSNADVGYGIQSVVLKNYRGDSFQIGFNLFFMLENFRVLADEKEVTFSFYGSNNPMKIEGENLSYILLPIRIMVPQKQEN